MNETIINKQLVIERFSKAVQSYDREAVTQRFIANRMIDLLSQSIGSQRLGKVLEVGCGTGIYSRRLLETFAPGFFRMNDICPDMQTSIATLLNDHIDFVTADAEQHDFGTGWDMITSCSTFQWFQQLEPYFERCRQSLTPRGILAFSTFGPDNLYEMKALTGHSLSYPGLQEIAALLAGSFELIVYEEESVEQYFDSPLDVLYHLKRTGVSGIRRKSYTKGELQAFCQQYEKAYTVDGKVKLTYHPLYIIAQKR